MMTVTKKTGKKIKKTKRKETKLIKNDDKDNFEGKNFFKKVKKYNSK